MKRFDKPSETLKDSLGHNNSSIQTTPKRAASELYDRAGTRFKVDWEPWSPGEPIIYAGALPEGTTVSDVETILVNLKSEGIL
jgi:hypothetical protein